MRFHHGCSCLVYSLILWSTSYAKEQQPLGTEKLADGVYAVLAPSGHPGESNSGFILLDDSVLVIDTHFVPQAANELVVAISKVTDLPIRTVVNTHWHSDHTLGNEYFVNNLGTDLSLISHQNTRDDLPSLGGARLEHNRVEMEALQDVSLVLPNLTFSKQLSVYSVNRRVQLLYFGAGHTRGDIVVYLPDDRIVFVGDLITGGPPFARDGYPFAWLETLTALLQLDVDTIIAGHGKIWRSKTVLEDRLGFQEYATRQVIAGAKQCWTAEKIAATIDFTDYRDTFQTEPESAPWQRWMIDFARRGLLELSSIPVGTVSEMAGVPNPDLAHCAK